MGAAFKNAYGCDGKRRSLWAGQAGVSQWVGKPVGYFGTYTDLQPIKSGGLGATYSIAGTGALAGGVAGGKNAEATLPGLGAFSSDVTAYAQLSSTLDGSGVATADITGAVNLLASLSGLSGFVTDATALAWMSSVLQGVCGIYADGLLGSPLSALLIGEGALTGDLSCLAFIGANVAGAGTVNSAVIAGLFDLSAALGGVGVLPPVALQGLANVSAVLSGSAELLADLRALAQLNATASGGGALTANLAGGWYLNADLAGGGTVFSAGLQAKAWLSAVINIGARPGTDEIASAVWNALAAMHVDPSTMGGKLNAAGAAGDPWAIVLPGAYPAGTAGELIGTRPSEGEIANAVWTALAALYVAPNTMGGKLNTAADPWSVALPGSFPEGTAGNLVWTRLELLRKLLVNRLELVPGTTNNWVLYDDDSISALLQFNVTDATGGPITIPAGAPARRTRGVQP